MNIKPINNQQQIPAFKSRFPVVHWVAESNGSYAPVANTQIVKLLQGKIIRMLNQPLSESVKPMNILEQRLRAYLGRCDYAYRNNPVVRSFYNRQNSSPSRFVPLSYIITGKDVEIFEEKFTKDIGRAKRSGKGSELQKAMDSYNKNGLIFVNDDNHIIKDETGVPYVMHTKFEIIRNTIGKIKGYKFIEARFLPENNEQNKLGVM